MLDSQYSHHLKKSSVAVRVARNENNNALPLVVLQNTLPTESPTVNRLVIPPLETPVASDMVNMTRWNCGRKSCGIVKLPALLLNEVDGIEKLYIGRSGCRRHKRW